MIKLPWLHARWLQAWMENQPVTNETEAVQIEERTLWARGEDPKLRQRIPGQLPLGHDAYLAAFAVGWVFVCWLVVVFFPSFPRLYWNLQSLAWTAGCALSCPSSFSFSFASQFKGGVNLSSKEAEGALDQDTGCLGTDSFLFVCVYVLGQGLGYPRILKLAVNLDMILPFWLSCLQLMGAGIVGRHHHTGFMGYRESNLGPDAC